MNDAPDLAGCRVIIAEDDAMLAMLLEETLSTLGCEIVASSSRVDDAAHKCEHQDFDVALLDVNLRGQPSLPIAETLLQRGQAFVITTGYSDAVLPESLSGVPVLHKPYRRRELVAAMLGAWQGQ